MKKNNTGAIKYLIIIFVIMLYSIFLVNVYKYVSMVDVKSFLGGAYIIQKKNQIQGYIDKYFYQDVDKSELNEGLYRGYLEGLDDPYSSYFTAEEYKKFNEFTTGEYAGIGAVLQQNPDTKEVVITNIFKDSPAFKSGLQIGDTIVSAEGVVATSTDLQTLVTHLKGEPKTKVSVVYSRNGEEHTVEITREIVTTPSVEHEMLDENTGYIQIAEFQSNTEAEFMEAIRDLEKQGMENIIYDVRSNPGGLVKTVTAILDDMLPAGITVYMEDKYGKRVDYTSDDKKQLPYPCVVLVNENSASSSEIFAGAIQDYKYGKILGTVTTGKGVVQNTFKLQDGSAIKLTVASYFTPNGTSLHQKGITPDIELEYKYTHPDDETYTWEHDNQILRAIEELD